MDNFERVGRAIASRTKATFNSMSSVTTEFGIIQDNLSLRVTGISDPIPKGSYMLDIRLAGKSYKTGEAYVDGGRHRHDMPEEFRGIRAGDRVAVMWIGNEPVVVAIVTES